MRMRHPDWDEATRLRLEAAYDEFVAWVAERLAEGRSRGRAAFAAAMETVRTMLTAAGGIGAARGEVFKHYLRRDFRHTADDARLLGRAAKQRLHPARLRDGALAVLAEGLKAGAEVLQSWSRQADAAIVYEAGEISSAGTLTCLNCGRAIHLTRTAPVPPCPDCLAARFRKSY